MTKKPTSPREKHIATVERETGPSIDVFKCNNGRIAIHIPHAQKNSGRVIFFSKDEAMSLLLVLLAAIDPKARVHTSLAPAIGSRRRSFLAGPSLNAEAKS
jgi:hypothetical protein